MAWILGRKIPDLNIERVLKIALVHDLTRVYAVDTTHYDKVILPKENFKKEFFYRNYKEEYKSLKKLTHNLPSYFSKELLNLFNDYQKGLTKEGRFVQQIDRIENLF